MFPVRLVLDTNVIISAALKADGLQRTVLVLAFSEVLEANQSNYGTGVHFCCGAAFGSMKLHRTHGEHQRSGV